MRGFFVSAAAFIVAVVDASVPKTEFTGSKLRPPVYLTGAYYSEPDGLFDEYLYVVPTVYIDA